MQTDDYQTISALSTGVYKEKGSKFFAYALPVFSDDDIKEQVEWVKKEHPKARHHCFAFRLGMDKNQYRANDDGEPSGTAGKPILGQIDSFGLTNIIIIVVRYFGGTKLGVPGLIHAYRQSSIDALEQAEIITKTVENHYQLSFGYEVMSEVMNALKKWNINVLSQDFGNSAIIKIAIPKSESETTLLQLKASILKITTEEASEKELEQVEVELI
ncbi:MAG: putative YigZ family protein [Maribacter sp.]|jgi:uncharacterized YigZ family protein